MIYLIINFHLVKSSYIIAIENLVKHIANDIKSS